LEGAALFLVDDPAPPQADGVDQYPITKPGNTGD
jgi:hypothetical protein